MEYKNIQSLASGETKDIIIHIGPILYIPRERNPCTVKLYSDIYHHIGTYSNPEIQTWRNKTNKNSLLNILTRTKRPLSANQQDCQPSERNKALILSLSSLSLEGAAGS